MNCKTCNFTLVEGQTVCPVCQTEVEGAKNVLTAITPDLTDFDNLESVMQTQTFNEQTPIVDQTFNVPLTNNDPVIEEPVMPVDANPFELPSMNTSYEEPVLEPVMPVDANPFELPSMNTSYEAPVLEPVMPVDANPFELPSMNTSYEDPVLEPVMPVDANPFELPSMNTSYEAPVLEPVMPVDTNPFELPSMNPVVEDPVLEPVMPVDTNPFELPNMNPVVEEPVLEPVMPVDTNPFDLPNMNPVVEEPVLEPVLEPVSVETNESAEIPNIDVVNLASELSTDDGSNNVFGFDTNPTLNEPIIEPVNNEQSFSESVLPNNDVIQEPVKPSVEPDLKLEKKGLSPIVTVIIGFVVVLLAAAAGYFGYKVFFKQDYSAPLKGYNYKISGKYNATIENNEKINIVDEKWNMSIVPYLEHSTIGDVEQAKEQIKESLQAKGYTVSVSAMRTVNNTKMFVNEVLKNNKKHYEVYTANKEGYMLYISIENLNDTYNKDSLEAVASIVSSAKKSK